MNDDVAHLQRAGTGLPEAPRGLAQITDPPGANIKGEQEKQGLRPEDVTVTASPNGQAVIEQIELLGPRAVVTLKLGDGKVVSVVEAGPLAALATGTNATLSFAPGSAHLFDATTEDRI